MTCASNGSRGTASTLGLGYVRSRAQPGEGGVLVLPGRADVAGQVELRRPCAPVLAGFRAGPVRRRLAVQCHARRQRREVVARRSIRLMQQNRVEQDMRFAYLIRAQARGPVPLGRGQGRHWGAPRPRWGARSGTAGAGTGR